MDATDLSPWHPRGIVPVAWHAFTHPEMRGGNLK